MKKLSILFVVLLLLAAACKKAPDCGLHGHNDKGNCVCDAGWSGANCATFDSCATINCGLHGHCVGGVCVCDTGWGGEHCTIQYDRCALLNTDCGPHGHCRDGYCFCDSGWSGANCECDPHMKSIDGVCVCDSGWGGVNCDVTCGGNTHLVNGACVCKDGWLGNYCDLPIDSFVGSFHMIGIYEVSHAPDPITYDTVDIIVTVTKINGTTLTNSLHASPHTFVDNPNYYLYRWSNGVNSADSYMQFAKGDITYLSLGSFTSSSGGSTSFRISGYKIH